MNSRTGGVDAFSEHMLIIIIITFCEKILCLLQCKFHRALFLHQALQNPTDIYSEAQHAIQLVEKICTAHEQMHISFKLVVMHKTNENKNYCCLKKGTNPISIPSCAVFIFRTVAKVHLPAPVARNSTFTSHPI